MFWEVVSGRKWSVMVKNGQMCKAIENKKLFMGRRRWLGVFESGWWWLKMARIVSRLVFWLMHCKSCPFWQPH